MKNFYKNRNLILLIISLTLVISSVLNFSPVVPTVSAGPDKCGVVQPDAQFWGNCAVAPYPGCKFDNSQSSESGWATGTNTTNRAYKTDATNPLRMEFQCFKQLSLPYGLGGMQPVYMEVKNSAGVVVGSWYRPNTNSPGGDELRLSLPVADTYTLNCYAGSNSSACLANSDSFKILPRVQPCTTAAPGAAALITPVNGSVVTTTSTGAIPITLSYDVITSGWGTGCPKTTTSSYVQYAKDVAGTCTGWKSIGDVLAIPASEGLKVGDKVCWKVTKSNSSLTTDSAVSKFTIINDTVTYTGGGITADVCKNGFSGISGVAGVSNPIIFNTNFTTGAGNAYSEVWLAAVPDDVAFNKRCTTFGGGNAIDPNLCQNIETGNPDIDTEANILSRIKNIGGTTTGFAVKLKFAGNTFSSGQVYTGNWTSTPANTKTSGDAAGWGVELQEIGATTTGNQTGSSSFKISIKNLFYGKYAFYTAALITNTAGQTSGSYDTAYGAPFVYKRIAASSSFPNWGVDLTPPLATNFSSKATSPSQFNVNWGAVEDNGLRVKSYVVRDNTNSTLSDSSAGDIDFNTVNSSTIPDATNFKNGTLEFDKIIASNGFLNETNLATRSYTDSNTSAQTSYVFMEYMQDKACNQNIATTTSISQNPWIISYNGDLSAGKGSAGLLVPSSLLELSDVLKDTSGATVLSDKQSTYFSSYGAITGNSNMPIRRQSKLNQYVTNYEDLTIKPPLDSGSTSWYDYMLNLVNINSPNLIDKTTYVSGGNMAGGFTSAFVGTGAGTKKHVVITGNLTVGANVKCDTQTIFFVTGNVTITPNFTSSGFNNGCMFVAKGDITIAKVLTRTNGYGLVDDAALAPYDLIEAALVSDSKLITPKEVPVTTQKGYGLLIKGSVVTEDVTLQRDVNLNANQLQPAHVFYFDPRFREIFKNDLNYNKYSIREVGFTNQ